MLNTEIIHRLQIIDVDAQAARGCASHFRISQFSFSSHAGTEGDCIGIIVQSLTFKPQAFAPMH